MRRVLLSVVWLIVSALPAAASSVTWEFSGLTYRFNGTEMHDIPDGTPVTVLWTFDQITPSGCAAPSPVGLYEGQFASVSFASPTMGPMHYAAHGLLIAGGRFDFVCDAPRAMPDVELRLISWTGPDVSDGELRPGGRFDSGGLFWMEPARADGLFPTIPPEEAFFMMSPIGLHQVAAYVNFVGVAASPTPVPEPSTMVLVGSGLIWMVRRSRRRESAA